MVKAGKMDLDEARKGIAIDWTQYLQAASRVCRGERCRVYINATKLKTADPSSPAAIHQERKTSTLVPAYLRYRNAPQAACTLV